jgi:hypothetical protein
MGIYRAQVVVPAVNSLSKDAIVNNWGLYTLDSPSGVAAIVGPILRNFYDAWGANRSSMYAWTGARLKLYHMNDPKPRVPVADVALLLSGSVATNTLPTEVSLCLSVQASRVSGQSQRRRRGRLYLGPFSSASGDGLTGRPASALRTTLATAAEAARVAFGATTVGWHVVSQPKPTDPMTSAAVTGGWIDDAWDTQRRRGGQPSARLIWGA